MPTIKMKKGYPTSDGFMHDSHADAVKSQCEINFNNMMKSKSFSSDSIKMFYEMDQNDLKVVKEWIQYCRKPKTAAPKKKTVKK